MDVKTKVVEEGCTPTVPNKGDAGMDLKAAHDFTAYPGYPTKVSLGVAFKIPEGYFGMLTHRSSLAFRYDCTCSLGIIDSSFDGTVHALIFNNGLLPRSFKKGDRICQIIFQSHMPVHESELSDFEEEGKEGFGSSGGYDG